MKIQFCLVLMPLALLSACASTIAAVQSQTPSETLYTQSQTVGLENSDRINRFERLASLDGVQTPSIDQLVAPAGTAPTVNGPVPVVRVVFRENVFFDSGSDIPLPQAGQVFDMIAQNMKRDVPDAALTILGHTDAVGTDAYNMDLSERRALAVMQQLADRGVNTAEMSTVAIGFHQPIAPNDSPEGRALNRRVEFLISANPNANLAVVQERTTDSSFFRISNEKADMPKQASVNVLQATTPDVNNKIHLAQVGPMSIHAPSELIEAPLKPPPLIVERELSPLTEAPIATASISRTGE